MPQPKIETFRIARALGKSSNWQQLRVVKIHVDALNEIGYSGTLNGVKLSLQEYFDTYIATNKEHYRVETLVSNPSESTDTLLVVKVTV